MVGRGRAGSRYRGVNISNLAFLKCMEQLFENSEKLVFYRLEQHTRIWVSANRQ